MKGLLLAVPLSPLLGSALLLLSARARARWPATVGCTAVGIAALAVLVLGVDFLLVPPAEGRVTAALGTWFAVDGFTATAALRLDPLSLVMAFVITLVGFLIHLYSSEYMAGEEGKGRYFAWLNLFVAAMLLLVLADDLLLLYVGWEGVGLCSYLLIGFWYHEPRNGYAARKAFVMTRFGDALLLLGLLYLATRFQTLRIDEVVAQARALWLAGAAAASGVGFLLLAGAVGKSAQVPLHTWLPDAMAGPTPVSALIHAATMVTAGVYLIARLHGLFELTPLVQNVIALLGAVTLLLGAFSALAQNDIKRVLAYSTVSQIGYMFLALGLGAWSAAIFHLFTHAFFKALLFLGAGAVIQALDHEQDLTRMGGLRRRLPLVFWTFTIGGASLAALPLVTAGFFSKELILSAAWRSPLLWAVAWTGAVLTAAYVTRLVVLVFYPPREQAIHHRPHWTMTVPLVALAVGAVVSGFVESPEWLPGLHLFSGWLTPVLGSAPEGAPMASVWLALIAPFVGAGLWWGGRKVVYGAAAERILDFWRSGARVDALYGILVERPWNRLTRFSAGELADGVFEGIARLHRYAWERLSAGQNGIVRRYAGALALGAALLLLANMISERYTPAAPPPVERKQQGVEHGPRRTPALQAEADMTPGADPGWARRGAPRNGLAEQRLRSSVQAPGAIEPATP
jgi:NADH-quinone oxidoreductase subunit L